MNRPNIDPSLYRLDAVQVMHKGDSPINIKEYQTVPFPQVKREFESFEKIDMENEEHKEEILDMFPSYLMKDADQADKDLFQSMSRYDCKNHTFIVGCFDTSLGFKLTSYKWREKDKIKWRTRSGTHPNNIPFVRIFTDRELIVVIEGQKDSLTAILLGLDFIMLPYAGYRNPQPIALQKEVRGRDVVFLVEDEPAYKCMRRLSEPLAETANSIILKQLNSRGIKVDLSDFVQEFNSIREVVHAL